MVASLEAWQRILTGKGRIFRVTFRTKTPQYMRLPDGRRGPIIGPAGRVREMVARINVRKFELGVISPAARRAEDLVNNVLTCFDVQLFNNLRVHLTDQGMTPSLANIVAGRRSYRRINMADVINLQGV
jgi:hypothetical protein